MHLIISEESQLHPLDLQERFISLQSKIKLKINNRTLNWKINNKEQEILIKYFVNDDKPKYIATKTKVNKEYVYYLAEKIKKVMISTIFFKGSSKLDLIEHMKTFEEEINAY